VRDDENLASGRQGEVTTEGDATGDFREGTSVGTDDSKRPRLDAAKGIESNGKASLLDEWAKASGNPPSKCGSASCTRMLPAGQIICADCATKNHCRRCTRKMREERFEEGNELCITCRKKLTVQDGGAASVPRRSAIDIFRSHPLSPIQKLDSIRNVVAARREEISQIVSQELNTRG